MEIELLEKIINKSKISFKPIDVTTGKIAKTGNGAHVLIKKEKALEIGLGKEIGILFFELDGERK